MGVEMNDVKLCVDCKWFVYYGIHNYCNNILARRTTFDVIYGEVWTQPIPITIQREIDPNPDGAVICGKDGKWFEPKDVVIEPQILVEPSSPMELLIQKKAFSWGSLWNDIKDAWRERTRYE